MSVRVLIVEDMPLVAEIMAAIARVDCGAETAIAHTMEEAQALLDAGPWDVVILDLQLPDSAAMETLAAIPGMKARGVGVVLAVTGAEVTERLWSGGLANGADKVVCKDVLCLKDELHAAVNQCLCP